GSLTVNGIKMSKSLGNFITIKDALKQNRPEVLRMFALTAHYSNPADYSEDALAGVASGWERMNNAVRLARQTLTSAPAGDDGNGFLERLAKAKADFIRVMDDDFNTPQAIATLQDLTRDVNTLLNNGSAVGQNVLTAIDATYNELGGQVLGIIPQTEVATGGNSQREAGLINLLLEMRKQARAQKNYAESDRIRDELTRLGVVLEDRADGTVWRVN